MRNYFPIVIIDPGAIINGHSHSVPPSPDTLFYKVEGNSSNEVLWHGTGFLTLANPLIPNSSPSIDPSWFVNATSGGNTPPQILQANTFYEGGLTYFLLGFTDPDNDAIGFGFHGVNGSGWAPEEHLFKSPSYGRIAPGQVEYPFNVLPGQQSDVAVYIYDAAGNHSPEVTIHLVGPTPAATPAAAPSGPTHAVTGLWPISHLELPLPSLIQARVSP